MYLRITSSGLSGALGTTSQPCFSLTANSNPSTMNSYLKVSLDLKMACPWRPVSSLTNSWIQLPCTGPLQTSNTSVPMCRDRLERRNSSVSRAASGPLLQLPFYSQLALKCRGTAGPCPFTEFRRKTTKRYRKLLSPFKAKDGKIHPPFNLKYSFCHFPNLYHLISKTETIFLTYQCIMSNHSHRGGNRLHLNTQMP